MNKIAVFGVPRSGTSWLSQILNSHPDVTLRFQPLFSYGHKGALSEQSSTQEVQMFFENILRTQDAFALMTTELQKNYPTFRKSPTPSHLVFKETRYLHIIENMLAQCTDVKVIGIVRNPLAVLTSWMQAPKEFDPTWNINSEWRDAPSKNQNRPEEFYGFARWMAIAETFLRLKEQFPQQFLLVRYDELNNRPLDTSKVILDFCGLQVCDQVTDFIGASKSRHDTDPYSVFRAKANDDSWQGILPDAIVAQIRLELIETPMNTFLQDWPHA